MPKSSKSKSDAQAGSRSTATAKAARAKSTAAKAGARPAAKPAAQTAAKRQEKSAQQKPAQQKPAQEKAAGAKVLEGDILAPETATDRAHHLALTAQPIVLRYSKWAAVGGILPLPLLDIVAVAGVNLRMVARLAAHYQQPFSNSRGKAIIWSLLGGLGPYAAGLGLGGTLAKSMPGAGVALGVVTMSATAAAATHAMGRLFIQHFDAGGTLFDMDPMALRDHYRQEFDAERQRR